MERKTLVNLTPHSIKIANEVGDVILEVPPSGELARVAASTGVVAHVNDIDVVKSIFGTITGLPESQPDTIYIVSMLVLQAIAGARDDVVGPDTGPTAVRDEAGRIVAVKRFQRFSTTFFPGVADVYFTPFILVRNCLLTKYARRRQ